MKTCENCIHWKNAIEKLTGAIVKVDEFECWHPDVMKETFETQSIKYHRNHSCSKFATERIVGKKFISMS